MGVKCIDGRVGGSQRLKSPRDEDSRRCSNFLRDLRKGDHQTRDDCFRHAHPVQKMMNCIAGEYTAQKQDGQEGKERTKKEPADQEFFGAAGITGKPQKQRRE